MRAAVGAADEGPGSGATDLLRAAASLYWARPDLTAAIAEHVLERAGLDGDRDRWLEAAGWLVHARSATGDGRDAASDVLEDVGRWGAGPLSVPAAQRLRVALAQLAVGVGELRTARRLLAPVTRSDTPGHLRADAFCVLARCAMEDAPDEVALAVRSADAAWSEVAGSCGELGVASVALVTAVAKSRRGRPDIAADRAAAGLARLEGSRGRRQSDTPSRHLATALAAEWISALLDAGRVEEAREGCGPITPRLTDPTRPSRQSACLRLAVARVAATGVATGAADALERAARDAAASDVPDLEAVCWSTLGAVQEQAGRLDAALEASRLGGLAQGRDRIRTDRLRAALADLQLGPTTATPHNGGASATAPPAVGDREQQGGRTGSGRAGIGQDRSGSRSAGPAHPTGAPDAHEHPLQDAGTSSLPGPPAEAGRPIPVVAVAPASSWTIPWGGLAGDSPIGDLLLAAIAPRADNGGHPERAPASAGPDDSGRDDSGRDDAGRDDAGRDDAGHDDAGRDDTGRDDTGRDDSGRDDSGRENAGRGNAGHENESRGRGDAHPHTGGQHSADPGEAGERAPERAPEPGRRRRRDDPWTTGQWPAGPLAPGPGATATARDDPDTVTTHPLTVPELGPVPVPAEGWLHAALTDLDRSWGRTTAAVSEPANGPADVPVPSAVGCVVVIDIAREGRRFAGRRAAAVLRAVADRLSDRLPPGARLRQDDADTLFIVLRGWDRAEATEWMHRALPAMLDGFRPEDDLPGRLLRAAVHDPTGPVGAQILLRLDLDPTRRGAAPELVGGGARPGRRRVVESSRGAESTGLLPPAVAATDDVDVAPRGTTGRHEASGGAPFQIAGAQVPPGSGGGRHRRGPDTDVERQAGPGWAETGPGPSAPEHAAPGRGAPQRSADGRHGADQAATDGLGLADLLAGALAAYRGI